MAAAKVARADFPNQVAAVHSVVGRDRAFAGVMRKAAALGAGVERQNGIGTQCAKAHGRNIEHTGAVRLGSFWADGDAKVMGGQLAWRH